ncbi:Helicase associated domain protein, partial [Arthrobacter sp.]|uniref:helicase associated domain-containing protein n=1 Tax=Arthrobacter sp. TaxID=1667 RepID=UPI0033968A46
EGLAVLPGWETKRRVEADQERWRQRLAELKSYRAAGYDWPRHKAIITGVEHELGVWLHSQRMKQSRGELNAAKTAALDQAVPGWRTGRKRGRPVAAKERDGTS